MFLRKAMRYYRLWIYTCNAVLLISVIVFVGVSVGVISHPYITLVPTPAPYDPSLLYGYVALFLQAGVLQAVGCLGALRLCQKLLNTYWLLLLSLLLGDLLVGLIWLIRFSHLTEGLKPYLSNTIREQYAKDKEIAHVWNALQRTHDCCGAQSPMDYYNVSIVLPDSCCHPIESSPYPLSRHKSLRGGGRDHAENSTRLRRSQVNELSFSCRESDRRPHNKSCAYYVVKWYKDSTETLMIFGFCVITFVKMCFVGILRFEIQEMIQKIKVLQGEANTSQNPELAVALGMVSPEKKMEGGHLSNLEDQSLLKETPQHLHRHNHIPSLVDGADSDTNSHCALITDTPVRNPHLAKKKQNGNNNDITELPELGHIRQTQI